MSVNGWRYYNHAAVPTCPPTESPDLLAVENGSVWNLDGKNALLARWTTDFDCGYETNWWYVIKDSSFDISTLKAKRRYEINKGTKAFEIKEIHPTEYAQELYTVQVAAYSAYPKKYRPSVQKDTFLASIEGWKRYTVLGAFYRETGELTGYALLEKRTEGYVDFCVMKTNPAYEKHAVNAALVAGVLEHFDSFLSEGGIICDGTRSINHETLFQDYLEKYFGFRKAYCKLHIRYNPKVKGIIKLLFPLRKVLRCFDFIGIVHQVNTVMKMEELSRERT